MNDKAVAKNETVSQLKQLLVLYQFSISIIAF